VAPRAHQGMRALVKRERHQRQTPHPSWPVRPSSFLLERRQRRRSWRGRHSLEWVFDGGDRTCRPPKLVACALTHPPGPRWVMPLCSKLPIRPSVGVLAMACLCISECNSHHKGNLLALGPRRRLLAGLGAAHLGALEHECASPLNRDRERTRTLVLESAGARAHRRTSAAVRMAGHSRQRRAGRHQRQRHGAGCRPSASAGRRDRASPPFRPPHSSPQRLMPSGLISPHVPCPFRSPLNACCLAFRATLAINNTQTRPVRKCGSWQQRHAPHAACIGREG
jgi:hypothetical protein